MMKSEYSLFLLVFLFLFSFIAKAEVRIQITEGVKSSIPIGIAPFKWSGTGIIIEDIGKIIYSDLNNSGKFSPLNISCFEKNPSTLSEIPNSFFDNLESNLLLIGQIIPSAEENFLISYQLINNCNGINSIISKNQYKVKEKWLRYAAHSISDEIFEKITGIKGVFRTRIAYVMQIKDKHNPYELRVSDYDGYNSYVIYKSNQPIMSPSWSPDGKKIAYVTFESGNSEIVIQILNSGIINKISSFPMHNGAPSFSPDGEKIAFALSKDGNLNLYLMYLNSKKIFQISKGRNNHTQPTWFPDSKSLAYTSDESGQPQIYKVNIDNNNFDSLRLSWEGNQNQNAQVSFDGKFIIMVNKKNKEQHLLKLDLTNNTSKVLTDTFLDETPSISPDGNMLIYSYVKELRSVLQIISIDGIKKVLISKEEGVAKFPAWSPYLR